MMLMRLLSRDPAALGKQLGAPRGACFAGNVEFAPSVGGLCECQLWARRLAFCVACFLNMGSAEYSIREHFRCTF
jgi:hypothetical protein